MAKYDYTPRRLSMLQTKAFCVISNVLNSHLRLEAQPLYQVNSTLLFVGYLVFIAALKSLHVSCDPAITISSTHNGHYQLALPCHPQACQIHKCQSYTALNRILPWSLPVPSSLVKQYNHLFRRTILPDVSPRPSGSLMKISASRFARKSSCYV